MSLFSSPDTLFWQGAADRLPARYVSIGVKGVKPHKGGLFGIGESPSLAESYPNAQTISGHRLDGDRAAVEVRAPGASIPAGLGKGSRVVLGLVDERHVICILVPPEDVPLERLSAWAGEHARK